MDESELLSIEERISIAKAAEMFGFHHNTLTRWRTRGIKNGAIKLRCQRIGGRWFTCREWLNEFVQKSSEVDTGA